MKNTKDNINNNYGITLIALTVTIIVILIIAGISVLAVSDQNGILNKATVAKQESDKGEVEELLKLTMIDLIASNTNQNTNLDYVLNHFSEYVKDVSKLQTLEYSWDQKYIIGKYDKYTFNINERLAISIEPQEQSVIPIGTEKNYTYNGAVQEFTVEQTGYYKVECWGASSGSSVRDGHGDLAGYKGAYTVGTTYMLKGEKYYIYVGGKGEDASYSKYYTTGGYNGGGKGDYDHSDDERGGAGGGATDIRLVKSDNTKDFASLKSRIMVAAGAGSSADSGPGTVGGTLTSENAPAGAVGASQTTGYKFGYGQDGVYTTSNVAVPGAGGGYYGGRTLSTKYGGATGGSSFISGFIGCNAISESSVETNIIHTGQEIHYSGKRFINSNMLSGKQVMPTYDGKSTMTGNSGNGYAKITFLSL